MNYIKFENNIYNLYSSNKIVNSFNNLNDAEFNLLKNAEEVELSYSAIMRDLNKNHKDDVEKFMKVFKKSFDEANINGLEDADKIALISALKAISYNKKEAKITHSMIKLADGVADIGNPDSAGKVIASIINFLLKKINPASRPESIRKLRDKIWNLNELEMATKKSPSSASIGNSISFVKNTLNGRDPKFIRETLRHIVGNL